MASASYLIARGMGSKSDGKARKSKTGEAPLVNPPPRNRVDEVGNARLGLWLGGKMLGRFLFCFEVSFAYTDLYSKKNPRLVQARCGE